MRAQEFIIDALVHRAHVGSSDPNDIWHVRDDTTRKLRSRRNQVVLANAQPVVMSADAMRSRTYNIGPNTGKRYQLLGGYHYAYLQGDLKSQFPDNVDQGRQLWFKNGRFIYADTQEPFTSADYVHFASDRTVTAYNVEQGNKLKEALHFVRPGELRGSYSDQQMQQMGFRRAQNGAWYIDQRRWDALLQQGKLREQHDVAEGLLAEETLDDFVASMKNRGAKIIGRGNNAMVFTNPDNDNTVIKVMHQPDPAYLAYLRQSNKHPDNPWLPQVLDINSQALDSPDQRSTTTVWNIILERLRPASGAEVKNAVDTVLATVDPRYLGAKPIDTYRTFDDIKKLWPTIAQHSSNADIRVFAEFLSQFRPQDIDVSNTNVMMRGPQLVFADPVLS
jgi:hypothetical protein